MTRRERIIVSERRADWAMAGSLLGFGAGWASLIAGCLVQSPALVLLGIGGLLPIALLLGIVAVTL